MLPIPVPYLRKTCLFPKKYCPKKFFFGSVSTKYSDNHSLKISGIYLIPFKSCWQQHWKKKFLRKARLNTGNSIFHTISVNESVFRVFLVRIFLHSDQKISEYGHFSCSVNSIALGLVFVFSFLKNTINLNKWLRLYHSMSSEHWK